MKLPYRTVLSSLAAVVSTLACADESGFYADFDLGLARYSYATAVDFPGVTLSASDSHIRDTAWGMTVGYRFMPYIGAEAGYVSHGKESMPASDPAGTSAAHGDISFTSKGPTLALVGAAQLGYWEMFLKLGYLFAQAEESVTATDGATKLNRKISASEPAPVAGVGLRYELNERWHVKVEFDHYDGVGNENTTGRVNIDVATLGVGCHF